MKSTTKQTAMRLVAATFAFTLTTPFASAQNTASPLPICSPALIQDHASTYSEGVQRGAADLIRSAGQYNYNTALGAIYAQNAVSRYLDNQIKRTQTYFEKRRINRQARAAERGPRSTQQQRERIAKSRVPERLDKSQYNRALGRVYWPDVLQGDKFAEHRKKLNALIADRAFASTANSQIKTLAADMKSMLKSQIRAYEPADYMEAKRFLSSLQYETHFSSSAAHVASSR